MRATIWGCRGSLATPGGATLHYGGNTSSVEVRTQTGALIVLDAGTGIRPLGLSLASEPPVQIHLLLTHMHLDHVEGLGFFAPIFAAGCAITIWGPRLGGVSLRDRIAAYLSPPLFPLQFEELPSAFEFVEVWEDAWTLDGVTVTSAPVQHPGGALGYRLDEEGRTLAFIPDNELGLDPVAGLELAAGADVLLHDAQYTTEEYRTRVGWGHSALDDFASFAAQTDAGRVVMFHHDPGHGDAMLDEMRAAAEELSGRPLELAAEGLDLQIG
jgi:phosphoribosyl 1,2-cyclic phosphodiesterase